MDKRLILAFLLLPAAPAAARDQFGGFQEFVDRGSIKPFTRDLGSVLGGATFHNGRSLGVTGFDVGLRGGLMLRPSGGNAVLRGRGIDVYGLPWVQAEIGLPFRLDGFIRGFSYQGTTIAGGGLRWQVRPANDEPWSVHFLLASSAHSVVHNDFSATHLGCNLVASLKAPKEVTPYVGGGVDRTRVVVRAVPDLDATLQGESATTLESRWTAGVSLRPFKRYLYLHAAYVYTHGQSGFDSGVGIRF